VTRLNKPPLSEGPGRASSGQSRGRHGQGIKVAGTAEGRTSKTFALSLKSGVGGGAPSAQEPPGRKRSTQKLQGKKLG